MSGPRAVRVGPTRMAVARKLAGLPGPPGETAPRGAAGEPPAGPGPTPEAAAEAIAAILAAAGAPHFIVSGPNAGTFVPARPPA